jgi:predicted Rossmann fold nucleotide-binding protein DprA/Smf involved in DNA uptake
MSIHHLRGRKFNDDAPASRVRPTGRGRECARQTIMLAIKQAPRFICKLCEITGLDQVDVERELHVLWLAGRIVSVDGPLFEAVTQ